MVTPEELVRHELIGLDVKITSSSNLVMIGIKGKVVDESRNTLTIETVSGTRTSIKDQCEFSFKIGKNWVKVDGELLVARPEDRVKKRFRKW